MKQIKEIVLMGLVLLLFTPFAFLLMPIVLIGGIIGAIKTIIEGRWKKANYPKIHHQVS